MKTVYYTNLMIFNNKFWVPSYSSFHILYGYSEINVN